jgi:hypothetical protein
LALSWGLIRVPESVGVTLLMTGFALLFVGGSVYFAFEFWAWVRRGLSREQRERVAAQAARLGLRSLDRDVSALDLSFSFFGGKAPPATRNQLAWLVVTQWRPRVEWIFAGTWRQLDVRIFDYAVPKDEYHEEEWTCVQLPIEVASPEIDIRRKSTLSLVRQTFSGRKDLTFGDDQFDRAFHVRTDQEDAARRVINAGYVHTCSR